MLRYRRRPPRHPLPLALLFLACVPAIAAVFVTEALASGRQTPIEKKIRACRTDLKELQSSVVDLDSLLKRARNGDLFVVKDRNGELRIFDTNVYFRFYRVFFALSTDKPRFIKVLNYRFRDLHADPADDLADFSLELSDYFAKKSRETVKVLQATHDELLQDIRKTAARCAALGKQPTPKPPAAVTTTASAPAGSLVLTPPIKVDPPQQREWTIDAQGGTATWDHCCDGGKWKVVYTFHVPDSLSRRPLVPGQARDEGVELRVGRAFDLPDRRAQRGDPVDPDPVLSLTVAGAAEGSKTMTLHVPASEKDARDLYIVVGFGNVTLTYRYHRAGA